MAVRLTGDAVTHGRTTSHANEIKALRYLGGATNSVEFRVSADLLERHDDLGLSLDTFDSAREFIEEHLALIGFPLGVMLHERADGD